MPAKKPTKPAAKKATSTKSAGAKTVAAKSAKSSSTSAKKVAPAKKVGAAAKKAVVKPAAKTAASTRKAHPAKPASKYPAAKASTKSAASKSRAKAGGSKSSSTKSAPQKAGAARSAAPKSASQKVAQKPVTQKNAGQKNATQKNAVKKNAAQKPVAQKAAAKPVAAKAAAKTGASPGKSAPVAAKAQPSAVRTSSKSDKSERNDRAQSAPDTSRKALTKTAAAPPTLQLRRLRPTKPTKDMYSAATGTNTSDPFPDRELDKFRQLISETRSESIEELEMLTEQLREMTAREVGEDNNAYSLHMAEQGTDAMEREKTFLQAQRTSDYVKKLGEALERIDNKSFGICRICGLRLDSKRLLAVPVTQVCTVYKNTSKPCEPGRLHMLAMGVEEDAA